MADRPRTPRPRTALSGPGSHHVSPSPRHARIPTRHARSPAHSLRPAARRPAGRPPRARAPRTPPARRPARPARRPGSDALLGPARRAAEPGLPGQAAWRREPGPGRGRLTPAAAGADPPRTLWRGGARAGARADWSAGLDGQVDPAPSLPPSLQGRSCDSCANLSGAKVAFEDGLLGSRPPARPLQNPGPFPAPLQAPFLQMLSEASHLLDLL
uniref:serine/arginine repetitive matrix protein 1-like n=1 Tax=Jaculus jaculus TaxID=51337 RepID=UPI001E1B37E1|nr:serine/arginine repetitive matrix protein 1-like [Jaculus jaculus]